MPESHIIVGPMTCQRCRSLVWYVRWFDMVYRQGLRDAEGVHRCKGRVI